jgi:hypothetical protein
LVQVQLKRKLPQKLALLADGAKDGLIDIVSDGDNITFVYSDQKANLTVEIPIQLKIGLLLVNHFMVLRV